VVELKVAGTTKKASVDTKSGLSCFVELKLERFLTIGSLHPNNESTRMGTVIVPTTNQSEDVSESPLE
jgi:hypothetical protein